MDESKEGSKDKSSQAASDSQDGSSRVSDSSKSSIHKSVSANALTLLIAGSMS